MLNGMSRDPIPPGDAEQISAFGSAMTLAGAGATAAGAGLAAGGADGAALMCYVAKELKDPCRNAIIAGILGTAMCQGKLPNSLRRDLERRDEIRRASDAVRKETRDIR